MCVYIYIYIYHGLVELQDTDFPFSLARFFLKTFSYLTV